MTDKDKEKKDKPESVPPPPKKERDKIDPIWRKKGSIEKIEIK